jgi:hypothetical protein
MKINKLEIESILKEELEDERVVSLLQDISRKLDKLEGLADIDMSIDTLTGMMSGVDPEIVSIGQSLRGRLALDPSPKAPKIEVDEGKQAIKELYGAPIPPPKPMDTPQYPGNEVVLLNPEQLEIMKKTIEPEIIQILKNHSLSKSNGYELLGLITRDLSNQLGDFNYEYEKEGGSNPSLAEGAKHPVRVRVRSSKRRSGRK